MPKNTKKLSGADYRNMWGEDGPYSQVRLSEEIRVLDNAVSRVFLVVEAEINPFTFEYIQTNRHRFSNDIPVIQLLDYAENRGKLGYVVGAGEVPMESRGAKEFARKQADMVTQTLMRMHAFVMDEFGLKKIKNKDEEENVEKDIGKGSGKHNHSPKNLSRLSGSKEEGIMAYIALAFEKKFELKKESVKTFAKTLSKISLDLNVDIENCESFQTYMLITVCVPYDKAPSYFAEQLIRETNKVSKRAMFRKKYLVTTSVPPTPEELFGFGA